MDPLLIVIVVILVVVIGYILSRPFDNPPEAPIAPSQESDRLQAYQNMLDEIKSLQRERNSGGDIEAIEKQINAKKQEAADLLRQINPSLDNESNS
jgi:hypothetical protein